MMLTVWGRKTSSNVQAVMWAIGEQPREFSLLEMYHARSRYFDINASLTARAAFRGISMVSYEELRVTE